jgi:choline kinase
MQALILAAGRGSRLGGTSYAQPKCLLEIGRRRLIEHQLDALAEAGVGPVHMVLGYAADEIREIVGGRAEYVINPRWDITNSLYSFWMAREVIAGDVMVLNSDVLFGPEILCRLLDAPGDAFAFDSASGRGREQMKVRIANGRLIEMSKDLVADESCGENVGILKLTAATAARLAERAGALIEAGRTEDWLGTAVNAVAREGELLAVDVAGLPWVEIDFPVDLARARKEVWPALQRGRGRLRRWGRPVLIGSLPLLALAAVLVLPPLLSGEQHGLDWETVPLDREPVRLAVGDSVQTWWLVDGSQDLEVGVAGPAGLRVETRLLAPLGEEEPYVIEVALDGRRVDWYKLTAKRSDKARYEGRAVGSRERVKLDVPAGAQRLTVRIVAPDESVCLVRVRQVQSAEDD